MRRESPKTSDLELTDQALVAQLGSRDEKSLLALIERYSQKVFNLAFRVTRNEQDSEEVLQDVFFTVFTKADKFEGKSAFSSWLYRVTVNNALMKLRKRRQHQAVSLEDVGEPVRDTYTGSRSDTTDIDYISTRHELKAALEGALERLPQDYRLIFILRDVDGLSNQEVSEIMDLSVPAIKSRLHRSRLMLRKSLSSFYAEYREVEVDETELHEDTMYLQAA